jgi:hypothetical protein
VSLRRGGRAPILLLTFGRGHAVTWSTRAKDLLKGGMVLLGLAAAFFVWVGVFGLIHQRSCDRLDAVRVSYLEPGHDSPGPGSIYVIGVGPGPPRSELFEYLEAEEALQRAGC